MLKILIVNLQKFKNIFPQFLAIFLALHKVTKFSFFTFKNSLINYDSVGHIKTHILDSKFQNNQVINITCLNRIAKRTGMFQNLLTQPTHLVGWSAHALKSYVRSILRGRENCRYACRFGWEEKIFGKIGLRF